MKLNFTFLLFLAVFVFLSSCGTLKNLKLDPVEVSQNIEIEKSSEISEDDLQYWHLLDVQKDSIPGMSVLRSYDEILVDKKGDKVIVAIIDSGVDISHPCLGESIWTNQEEIPNNNIDDDGNGYVDDIHGWNFLGNAEKENLEVVRLLKTAEKDSDQYNEYKEYVDQKLAEIRPQSMMISTMYENTKKADSVAQKILGKATYTLEDLETIEIDESNEEYIPLLQYMKTNGFDLNDLKDYNDYLYTQLNYHYNIDFDGRSIVGDNPHDFDDQNYGDGRVSGPEHSDSSHGTHVSGIALFSCYGRDILPNVEIMVLRAVPDGDEYDKDVALAIRYAVDHGADIINTSFGKSFSPHPQWVYDALKHAEENDVLIVNAAGNEGVNINHGEKPNFIRDHIDGVDFVDNFITVGATSRNYNANQVASFSNYGNHQVDLFAPGEDVYSALPNNKKDFNSGTSMAAPNVTAVSAVLRSYFPKLNASEIKHVLMTSGVPLFHSLTKPSSEEVVSSKELAKSPRMVNLYNALIYASAL
ncbi:MAG: S8 family serine peptidase [Flavobacteriaceae bacterium]|nr:S8 family serine peptidase [Flavobacteriaceae bacterium]MCY4267610.1 S8 family serine peptidase [Flavobacteriaceae bacterium]